MGHGLLGELLTCMLHGGRGLEVGWQHNASGEGVAGAGTMMGGQDDNGWKCR
jgi:hypothetical protein